MLENVDKCCGSCCWFKFETLYGDGFCCHSRLESDKSVMCDDGSDCRNYVGEDEKRHYLAVLLNHNRWMRYNGSSLDIKMADPKELWKAIDFLVDYCKKM